MNQAKPGPVLRRRILIVDDCTLTRRLMESVLGRAGFDVYFAESGAVAIDALVGGARGRRSMVDGLPSFDLLLVDVNMPGLSGPETVRRLRSRGFTKPVVACSAGDSEEDVAACLAAGSDAFVRKPVSAQALLAACEGILSRAA